MFSSTQNEYLRAKFLKNACFMNIHELKFIRCVPKIINLQDVKSGVAASGSKNNNKKLLDSSVNFKNNIFGAGTRVGGGPGAPTGLGSGAGINTSFLL